MGELHVLKENANAGDNASYMQFKTRSAGGSTAEKLRIDSTGHIYIKGQNHEVRWYRDDEARYGAITYDSSNFNIKNPVNDHTRVCKSDGKELIKFHNNGDLLIADGDLVISTAGHGIDFSAQTGTAATGAATGDEVLDHYEEGTWTAKAYESGNAITLSYNNTHGRYTRVGNMVTLWMWIRASGTTTSTGGLQIGGLPFASNADSYRPAIVGRAYNLANFTGKSGVCFWMGGSSSTITVVAVDSNGLVEGSNVSNNVWQSGAELHCTFSYFV